MGKWCEVKCNCSNRKPLSGSEWWDYSHYCKYQKKPRLAKTIKEWEEKVKGMYECGHRDGVLIEFTPSDLFTISNALEKAYEKQPEYFEVFRKIGQYCSYDDELLVLSSNEISLWQLEIEQLRRYLSEEEFMGWHEREAFEKDLAEEGLLYGSLQETLEDGMRLCKASVETGNPIEFLL
jgi:regulator of replication initiation timing